MQSNERVMATQVLRWHLPRLHIYSSSITFATILMTPSGLRAIDSYSRVATLHSLSTPNSFIPDTAYHSMTLSRLENLDRKRQVILSMAIPLA